MKKSFLIIAAIAGALFAACEMVTGNFPTINILRCTLLIRAPSVP